MSRIEIRPKGGIEVENYVESVMEMKEELTANGIEVATLRTRAEPITTTILISIIGSVLSHYIIKVADRLMKKTEEQKDHVQIVIIVNQQRFELPAEYDGLRARLALMPGQERSDPDPDRG